jgi:hypothetical protein
VKCFECAAMPISGFVFTVLPHPGFWAAELLGWRGVPIVLWWMDCGVRPARWPVNGGSHLSGRIYTQHTRYGAIDYREKDKESRVRVRACLGLRVRGSPRPGSSLARHKALATGRRARGCGCSLVGLTITTLQTAHAHWADMPQDSCINRRRVKSSPAPSPSQSRAVLLLPLCLSQSMSATSLQPYASPFMQHPRYSAST